MKIKTSSLTPILIILALLIAAMTIPINSNKDIYLTVTVEKPVCFPFTDCSEKAKITDITGYASPHTLVESLNLADITGLNSGQLKIAVESGNLKSVKAFGSILKDTSSNFQTSLRNIPASQSNVTVKLYESNVLVDTKIVTITGDVIS